MSSNVSKLLPQHEKLLYWCGRGDTAPTHYKPRIYGPFPILSGPALDLNGCTCAEASLVYWQGWSVPALPAIAFGALLEATPALPDAPSEGNVRRGQWPYRLLTDSLVHFRG
jgi:hypothetical protein